MILTTVGQRRAALFICFTLILCLAFTAFPVLASEGGGHAGGKLMNLLYRFINFALLVIILFFVIRKTSLKDFFSARREEIGKKLETLQKEKNSAENRYKELERKLKEFEKTREEILERFMAEGEAEKEKIISQAKARASQILDQVDGTIQREVQAARDRLRAELIEIAAGKAEEIVRREINDKDQEHLVNEFIERLGTLH